MPSRAVIPPADVVLFILIGRPIIPKNKVAQMPAVQSEPLVYPDNPKIYQSAAAASANRLL